MPDQSQEQPKELQFVVDPEISKGRFADTVNFHMTSDTVCMTFAVRETLGNSEARHAVARIFVPFALAKVISEQLIKLEAEKKAIPNEL